MVTHIAESPEPQDPSSPLMEETASSLSPRMEQVRRRVRNVGRVIRMKKVCEHCGMAFNKSHKYMQHLRTHRPLQQCDKCSFKTKDLKRFRNHQISHKKENPDVKCNLCTELFATTTTRRIHKKKIHKVFECKYCCKDYQLEEEMINHMTENHGHTRDRPGYLTAREMKNVKPVNIFLDPPSPGGKSQFVCRLCNKETRNKYQLKIHIAQHLGVSSNKISDDFLITQDVEQFNRDGVSVSSFGSDDNTADDPKPGHSDYLFPQYMSVKREPESALEDGFEHRGTSADTTSFISIRSETSSISSITYNSDTSPAATMQDLFSLTTNRAEEIDIDDAPLLQKFYLKEEPESWSDSQNTVVNDSSGVRCGVCDIYFLEIDKLHNHVLTAHNKLIYRCSQCEQIFPKAEDLFKHRLTEHGKAASNAKPEKIVKPSQLELNEVHTVLPQNKPMQPAFYCEICRESFTSAKKMRSHEKIKHRKIFTCQVCSVTHYQTSKMIRHQKVCHKDMFRCRYLCMALFDTEAERSVHHLRVHNKDDTKVTCPYCKVEYQYEGNLMNHLDRCKNCPPDKRPAHVCGNCNNMFPSIEHYNVHIKDCRPGKKDSEKTKAQNEDKRKPQDCGTSSKEDVIDVDPLQDAAPRNEAIPEVPVNRTKEGVVRPSLGDEDDELEPFDISVIENVPLQLNPVQNKSVNSSPGVKFFKVCEYCGRAFNKKAAYIQHRNSHRPVQQCKKCNFKTKDVKRFKEHVDSHEENKTDIQCNLCPLQFTNILSRRNHKKNVHNVYECNHCSVDYISESKLKEHINDSHLPRKGVYVAIENVENGESSSIVSQESFSSSSPKKYLVCRLCNKETRNKYQLKIHLAQHLGVSSSTITDDNLLLEDVEQFAWDEENEIHIHSENNAVYRNAESEGAGNVSILSSEVHKEVRLRDGELDSIQLQGNLIVKEEPIEIDIVEKHHDAELTRYQAPIIFPRRVGRPMVMLTCDQCGDTFKSPKALRNHQKLRHRRLVKCPACNITRVNTKKMLAHQKTAHKNKFRCHFHCLALFDTRNELSSHHLNIHKKDDSKLVCRYCRQNYPRGTYMNHLKHCEEDPLMRRAPCICSHCEASFSSPDELTRHMKFCSSKIPEPESSKTVEKKDFDLNTEVVEDNVSKSKEEKTVSSKSKPVEKEDVNLDTDMAEDNILISKKEETVSRKSLQSSILKEKVVIDCTSQVQDNMITEKVKEAAQDKVGPQRCKYCSKTFDTVDDGINHVLCSHRVLISNITKEPRMCHLCGKNFLSGLALCKHILKHYSDTGLWDSLVPPDLNMETVRSICWICKTKGMVNHRYHATRRDNFIEKLLTTRYIEPDSNDIYHCSACDEGFQSRFAFWKHIKLHMSKAFFKNAEGGKRFKCTRCPLKFLKKSQLYGHIATHLLDPYIITQGEEDCVDDGGDERCESDEASNKTLGGAKNSIAQNKLMVKHAILAGKLSSSQVPQKCKRCRKKFKSLEDAVEHVFTTHKTILGNMMDDTQACHVCDKTFMKPMILCKHLLIHYRELNMLDDLVPRDLLKRTKDRRYCWICNNMLGRKASRHINMRNNVIEKILSNENEDLNEEDNFPCSLCGDVCTTRYNFWKHIVLHMYKFPKKFKKVSDSSSPNSSEASKELRCSDCSLRFNEKSALNKHLATHFLLPYTGQEIEEEKTTPDKKDTIPCIEEIIPDKTDDPVYTESKPSEKNQASNNTIRLRNKVPKLGDRSYSSQQCTCCSEIFQNTDEAVRHVISLHKSEINQTICQPFKCHMCGTVFKSTWCLCKHISKHYSNLGMWDALVPHDLLDSYDLRNQCWICKGQLEKNYTDHINKRNVVIEKLLLTKMNQAEDSEDFKCSLCDRFYKGRLTFWRHIQLHLSKAPIKVRGKRVVKPPLNIIDYENHQFSCNECSLYFLDEQELYEHLATHFICKYEEMQAIQNVSEDSQSNLSFGEELEPLVHIELQTKRKLGEGEGHKLDVLSDQVDDSNQRKKRKILKTGRNKDDEEVNTEWEIEEDTDIEESESECDIESMDEIETDDEVGEETDE